MEHTSSSRNTGTANTGIDVADSLPTPQRAEAANAIASMTLPTPTTPRTTRPNALATATAAPARPTRTQAHRFLTQATFGPQEADIARVMALGYEAWIDEQLATPASSHGRNWDAADAAINAANRAEHAGGRDLFDSFYTVAITGQDQLRQRVVFALSQIFVISMVGSNVNDAPRGIAGYLDMLGEQGLANYRGLIESVATHPMVGLYLSHLRNMKEDAATGRVPDENFAREVMQLFSIGLYRLDTDGSVMKDAHGHPIETYGADDVSGMAKVFTGWGYHGPDTNNRRWSGYDKSFADPDRFWMPMQSYPQYHSTSEKRFLGRTIPAQATPDGKADLTVAMDALYSHPNVGPFIGRQLIQRLVTSNPSPAYVRRVAGAFNDNGRGVRGDMTALLKAVLLDPEARSDAGAALPTFGKVREPVLRLTAVLRAFDATSDSGKFLIATTDNPAELLGQSPVRAPSVFNFYRPGFVAPGSRTAAAGLVAPELQITNEASVAGYANYLRGLLESGAGVYGVDGKAARKDVRLPLAAEMLRVDTPAELVEDVTARLMGGAANAEIKALITQAVASVPLPAPGADAAEPAHQKALATARRNRAAMAVYLAAVAPEFVVQR
ncbi:MAG: hypothetical protein JWP52_4136 [Rhizobacter sp.]|nr:hypothetical protein [Rhizobacter sp.]